jgi:hypothetical protein
MIDHSSRNTWGPRSFQIQILDQNICYAPLYHGCCVTLLCNVFAMLHCWGCRSTLTPLWAPLTLGLGSGLKLGSLDLTKSTIGKVFYNFCSINFAWKWLTSALEVHGAWVLPGSDYGSKNVICTHSNKDPLQVLFQKVFTKSNGWDCRSMPDPI